MFAISSNNIFTRYADSVVYIRYHPGGFYVLCEADEAEGFCAKMAVPITDKDGNKYHGLSDTVFRLEGHELSGTEPVGSYEEMGAAIPLTDAESAKATVTALAGEPVTYARAVKLRPIIEQAAVSLSDGEAASVPELITAWAYPVAYAEGDRRSYGGKVYKVRPGKGHTSQANWTPEKTPNLWAVIDAEHAGTQEDPIPAARGMEYEYGKYYLDGEDGKVYLCERTGEQAGGKITLQYLPHELIGNYFKAV